MRVITSYLKLLLLAGVLIGCSNDSNDSSNDSENDSSNDSEKKNDTDSGNDTVSCDDLEVSGMVAPPTCNVEKPSGDAKNLSILDWAGFKGAVTYTYDDSQPTHIDHYDALNETGVPMTFFITSSTSGSSKYDETFSQAVKDGHEMANHTAHHCRAAGLSDCGFDSAEETAEAEIEVCNDYIIDNFGQKSVWTMASPFGDTGWGEFAKKYFFLNRGVNRGTVAPNDDTDPFELPSLVVEGTEDAEELADEIDNAVEAGEWLIFCIHSVLPGADWYNGIELESITGSIDHIKTEGDIWADTMANIGAYWVGQKLLNDAEPTEDGDKTVWKWTLPDHFPTGKYLRVTVDGGTLTQDGKELRWSPHGYYEVALDEGELTLAP